LHCWRTTHLAPGSYELTPHRSLMVVDFKRFVTTPEVVVREVLAFLGADGDR